MSRNIRNRRRNALLVYPEFPRNSFLNHDHLHRLLLPRNEHGYPQAMMPPLGLLSVIGTLRERYGEERVRLLDMNCRPLTDTDLEWADDVYLGGMLAQCRSFEEAARRAKRLGKTTIGGGPCAGGDRLYLDHCIVNECEYTLGLFLDDLFAGRAARVYEGEMPRGADFFTPVFSAVDLRHYGWMVVQFSRGCPHDCEFCDITSRYGREMRTKGTRDFLKELDQLYELKWRGQVFIVDDNFIGKPRAALALLQSLEQWQKERNYPFEFHTQATLLLAEDEHDDLLRAFSPAGFSMIFMGIDSPNPESLRETNKGHNLRPGRSLVEKVRRIQQVGKMLVLGGLVLGFDSDDAGIFDAHIRFVRESGLPLPMFALLSPLPHTKLEKRLCAEDRLHPRPSTGSGTEVTFRPKSLSEGELIEGYQRVLRQVHLDMDGFYRRCLDSLSHFHFPRVIVKPQEVTALFRLLYYEGVAGGYRGAFWKYVLRILRSFPAKLPYGLRWAAFGLHNRRLATRLTTSEPGDH